MAERREASFPIGAAATIEELAADPHPLLVDFLGMQLMLRGRQDEAAATMGEMPTPGQSAISGWCALQRGERLSAIDHFETGFARLKKETGKRKIFFENIAGQIPAGT